MKKYKDHESNSRRDFLKNSTLVIGGVLSFPFILNSCSKDNWLKETPLDFYTTGNSYVTESDFLAAVVELYANVASYICSLGGVEQRGFYYPTDIAWDAISLNHELQPYSEELFSNTGAALTFWSHMYKIIANSNVVLSRIGGKDTQFSSEQSRAELKAEASFFRAFAYRCLGIVYGGVPIILQEIDSPQRNFTRSTQEDVFQQCVTDLMFAAENLPDITKVSAEGRISNAVANHLLTEVYIILKDWDNAIAAATKVISNPNFSLMTQRFGSRINFPGDVYSDLFRRDNQYRSAGNTEAIWVNQYAYQVTGGGASMQWPYFLTPMYWQLKDPDGVNLFIGPTTQNGGRGIGWFGPTPYVIDSIWENDPNDMRNSQYNIVRDIKADNPKSRYYGQYIVASGAIVDFPNTLDRWWRPIFAKGTIMNEFPAECIVDASTGLVNSNAEQTYTANYIFRLAETYLLRAEAYLGKGDLQSSANDINVVRARANAIPVLANEVDINYILDERARELSWEELRLLTLMRLGLLVERVKKYNSVDADGINAYQNLWPIPFSEIQTNTGAKLTQNPGY